MDRTGLLRNLALATALVCGALSAATVSVAQDESQTASHPSHIHIGTCDELDPNPVMPLNNIEPITNADDGDDQQGTNVQGVLTASQVLYAESDDGDQLSWDDMLAQSHSINVHESDENIQNYIACGEIGGVVVDDRLVITLHPMNDSGYTGIAILEKDDDNIDVEVYLAAPRVENVTPTPDATPVT